MSKKAIVPLKISGILELYKKLAKPKKAALITLASTTLLALIYLIYCLLFLGKVYPNVVIGSANFGGMKTDQVKSKLVDLNKVNKDSSIKLIYSDRNYSIKPEDISWEMNLDETTNKIVSIGRQDKWWKSAFDQLKAPFFNIKIDPVVSYDSQTLDQIITNFSEIIDNPAKDASAKYVNGKLTISREQVGKRINRAEVAQTVLDDWATFHPGEIALEMKFDTPKIVLSSAEELESAANELSKANLTLTWSSGKKTLNTDEVKQLIGFIGKEPAQPLIVNDIPQKILTAAYTQEQIKIYLEGFDDGINQPAKDPKLVIKDGALTVAEKSQEGRVVDLEKTSQDIYAALTGTPAVTTVEVSLTEQLPIITESRLNELGIKQRIGYGETSFTGSTTSRRANIVNGVRLLQSALIKPGDEFSTVKTLGAVDDTTGFLPELVIKENRTTPEYGGGLCQVSTTLFRSVLNAGLKVTERQNHSYRVSYYEPPVGLDATIYLPRPDFKFVNDTPGYILIQGRVAGNKVIFELWGTSDGRTSAVTDPVVSNITPPGDPVYEDTDTLFKGETKQVEKAHDGAIAIAYYTVTRNGQVINKQTFKSIYKPWPARFLVGTKDPPVDPNAPPV